MTAAELPVDELGLIVLRDMLASQTWNWRNYVLEAQQYAGYKGEPSRALVEAIRWLQARGLIAEDPDPGSPNAMFVTRIGRKVVEEGPDAFYATERLQRNLHRTIEAKARPQFLLGEYEQGVFASMKAVEVRVRALGGFGDEVIGVDLMNRAFGPHGALTDSTAQKGGRRQTPAQRIPGSRRRASPSGRRRSSAPATGLGRTGAIVCGIPRTEGRLRDA